MLDLIKQRRILSICLPAESSAQNKQLAIKALEQFSPTLQEDTHLTQEVPQWEGLNVDLSASIRLFKGELNIFKEIILSLRQVINCDFRLCLSPTLGAAWALARYGSKRFQIIGENIRSHLAPLPLSALRITRELEQELNAVNLYHIGELYKICSKSLLARFNPIIIRRLNQALGLEWEVIEANLPLELPQFSESFFSPLENLEYIKQRTKNLLSSAVINLKGQSLKLKQFKLELSLSNLERVDLNFLLHSASNNLAHLGKLLDKRLEKTPLFYSTERIRLCVIRVEREEAEQCSFVESRPFSSNNSTQKNAQKDESDSFSQIIDTVAEQIGSSSIHKLICKESYIPEKSFEFSPTLIAKESAVLPQALCQSRPSIILNTPLHIQCVQEAGGFYICLRGERYNLLQILGPERISPDWWELTEERRITRDYFKAQLETGNWAWFFKEIETEQWFLHGLWY